MTSAPPCSVVIAGASGLVGSHALSYLLRRDDVNHVSAIGRRDLGRTHDKLSSVRADFHDAAAVARAMPESPTVAMCCLGTTMRTAGSEPAFRAVDYDAIVTFGEAARLRGTQRFVLVSSMGADPGARNFYLRTKGETEERLATLGFTQLTVIRPSFIDDRGARTEHRPLERLSLPLLRAVFLFAKTSRYAPIPVDTLARAVVALAFDGTQAPVRIVEGRDIHDAARGRTAYV